MFTARRAAPDPGSVSNRRPDFRYKMRSVAPKISLGSMHRHARQRSTRLCKPAMNSNTFDPKTADWMCHTTLRRQIHATEKFRLHGAPPTQNLGAASHGLPHSSGDQTHASSSGNRLAICCLPAHAAQHNNLRLGGTHPASKREPMVCLQKTDRTDGRSRPLPSNAPLACPCNIAMVQRG